MIFTLKNFHIAALHGCLNLLKTLKDEDNFDVPMADNDGWRALHYSARNGSYELFIFFVDKGSMFISKRRMGQTVFLLRHSMDI